MSPSVVLCIERESYVSALVAFQIVIESSAAGETKEHMRSAFQDFQRAHATYLAIDACITTPALLRRQAG